MTVIRQVCAKTVRMQALVDKFDEYEKKKSWNAVYIALQNDSEAQQQEFGLTHNVATKEHNQVKNRYCNVIPYDQNRVRLASTKNDYINASPMTSELNNRDYIFSQGPLESTSSDFWQMIYEQEAKIIVMLTDCVEWGQVKCHPYFPTKEQEATKLFGNYSLELIEEEANEWYTTRKLKLTTKKGSQTEPRIIHHFQYTNWPDFGTPEDVSNFTDFVEVVRNLDDSFEEKRPIVTHCSAGIGRSGTFVVADVMLTALRSGKKEDLPMIDDLILQMRRSRMYLVQTPAQLRFCWKAVVDWIRRAELEVKPATESDNSIEEVVKNGDTSMKEPGTEPTDHEDAEKHTEPNGDVDKEEVVAVVSPGKRASTDEEKIILQNRRQKIEGIRQRQRAFERRKAQRDYWIKQLPYIIGSAILVGFASILIYRYVGSGESEI